MEYTRDCPIVYHTGGTTYSSARIPYDDADHMNHGLFNDLLFPEHRHTRFSGGYSRTAPYGEIFDILSPNEPGRNIDPKIFDGYKVLFALGGQRMDARYVRVLKSYVEAGGTFVLNAADTSEYLPLSFFGVASAGDPIRATQIRNSLTGREFDEQPFMLQPLTLDGGGGSERRRRTATIADNMSRDSLSDRTVRQPIREQSAIAVGVHVDEAG